MSKPRHGFSWKSSRASVFTGPGANNPVLANVRSSGLANSPLLSNKAFEVGSKGCILSHQLMLLAIAMDIKPFGAILGYLCNRFGDFRISHVQLCGAPFRVCDGFQGIGADYDSLQIWEGFVIGGQSRQVIALRLPQQSQ